MSSNPDFPVKGDPHNPKSSIADHRTIEQAAQRLNITPDEVKELLRAGHLAANWVREASGSVVPRVNSNSMKAWWDRQRAAVTRRETGRARTNQNNAKVTARALAVRHNVSAWTSAYAKRISEGREGCRVCGEHEGVQLVKRHGSETRGWAMERTAILCSVHSDVLVPSLFDEERKRPVEQRWGFIAIDRRRRDAETPGGTA